MARFKCTAKWSLGGRNFSKIVAKGESVYINADRENDITPDMLKTAVETQLDKEYLSPQRLSDWTITRL